MKLKRWINKIIKPFFIRKKFFQALSEFYQECLFSFSCLNLTPSFPHQSLGQSRNRVCLLQMQGYRAEILHRLFQ